MRIPDSFRDATILRKLMLIAFFATAGGTLFALLLLSAQQWFLQRNELANNVRAQAAIVAINGSSALLFDDRRAAEQTMEALAAIDNIEYAVIVDKSGKYFADYARPGAPIATHHHSVSEGGAAVYTMNHLEVVVPIVLKQEQIGTIHVISNLAPVYNRLMWSLLVTVIAAMGAFLAVVMLLRRLLPVITDPLQYLVGLMNAVSMDKNYTLRAKLQSRDELGVLAQGFNDMLAQIQQRDEYLARHQEHLEEEVVKRTARLTEAQRIAHLGNWEWDIVSNMLDWSDEIYRIFGLTPQQFGASYDAFLHAVHPEDRQSVDDGVRDALEKNIPYSLDHRILLPDGSVRYVHEQAEVLRADDGQPVKMRGTVQDITKDKLAEEKIRESEARYRGVFEYADDIIYLLAPDGTFNSLSPSFERLTGWQPQEWLGKSFAPIIHPDDLAYARTVFQNALDGQSTPLFELRLARKSGEYFDSELSLVPVSPGGKIAAIGIARDITECKQAEQEILRLNEMLEAKVLERTKQLMAAQEELVRSERLAVLGQVAGSVGHELRNPLGVMNNAVYFLQTVLSDADETTREYLNIIKDEIAASERIVSDLLDSVRTKPPHSETVGIAQLIAQTLRKCNVPPSVSVKLDISETLPPLRVDGMQIHQVFRNLISNGVEAMPQGGTLEISAVENKPDATITVSVRDSGVGMPPEQQSHLFQPLFTTKARGIGLGLVVVKNLTQANGGTVRAESMPGKGTIFSVTLPVAKEAGISI